MGAYISQSDIEAVFGTQNVAAWSNVDTTQDQSVAVTARINNAIGYAEEYVQDRFRQGPYAVPFVKVGANWPFTLIDMMAKIAGVWLYSSRGIKNQGEDPDNRILFHQKAADEAIDLYMARTRKMNLGRSEQGPTAPQVVNARISPAIQRWENKGYFNRGCPCP